MSYHRWLGPNGSGSIGYRSRNRIDLTAPLQQKQLPPAIRGGLWTVGSAASFTVMTALIREAATGIHPFEIGFFRALVNLVLMIPFAFRTGGAGLRSNNHTVFVLRGVCGLVFLMTYFAGAAMIPLAESQMLVFASPLWSAVLAVIFLGERVNATRVQALIAGFPVCSSFFAPVWSGSVSARCSCSRERSPLPEAT